MKQKIKDKKIKDNVEKIINSMFVLLFNFIHGSKFIFLCFELIITHYHRHTECFVLEKRNTQKQLLHSSSKETLVYEAYVSVGFKFLCRVICGLFVCIADLMYTLWTCVICICCGSYARAADLFVCTCCEPYAQAADVFV